MMKRIIGILIVGLAMADGLAVADGLAMADGLAVAGGLVVAGGWWWWHRCGMEARAGRRAKCRRPRTITTSGRWR